MVVPVAHHIPPLLPILISPTLFSIFAGLYGNLVGVTHIFIPEKSKLLLNTPFSVLTAAVVHLPKKKKKWVEYKKTLIFCSLRVEKAEDQIQALIIRVKQKFNAQFKRDWEGMIDLATDKSIESPIL